MAINYSQAVYKVAFDVFARPIVVTPVVSQPGRAAYNSRGIYNTGPVDVEGMEGSIMSDTVTVCDVRDAEHKVVPMQGDRIRIPAHIGMPSLGEFEVIDADPNGGGETTLALRAYTPPVEPFEDREDAY